MEGYFLDNNNISNALQLLYQMTPTGCVKLGLTEEAVKEYIFGGDENANVFHISFRYNIVEREAIIKRLPNETSAAFTERCRVKALELLKKYGFSDIKENESTQSLLNSLETLGIYLENEILYDKLTHLQNVYAFYSGMLINLGYDPEVLTSAQNTNVDTLQQKVNEAFDQLSKLNTGVEYDKTTKDAYIVNEILISEKTDGKYYIASKLYDMIVEADAFNLAFLEWNSKNWYHQFITWVELPFVTDIQVFGKDKEYIFTLDNSKSDQSQASNSKNMEIYFGTGANKKKLDYTLEKTYMTDTGSMTTEYIDALTNFREFYQIFEYVSLNGLIDEDELSKMSAVGLSPEICKTLPDEACDLILYYRAVDPAGNSIAKVIRFYTYSGHAFVTVEVVDAFDENGNPTSDWKSQSKPENAKGLFYADAKYIAKLLADADRVSSGQLVDVSSKN
jgi:hypothetical protein